MDKSKRDGVIAIVFVMLLGFAIIGSFVASQVEYAEGKKDMKQCKATVTSVTKILDRHNVFGLKNVMIKYTVDGVEYQRDLSSNTGISFKGNITNLKEGDKVEINYNPDDPMIISSETTQTTGLFLAFFGVFTVAFGVFVLVLAFRKKKKSKN